MTEKCIVPGCAYPAKFGAHCANHSRWPHASLRFKQRYGKTLTEEIYRTVIKDIQSLQSNAIRITKSRAIHRTRNYVVVYSSKQKEIITFLPPQAWRRYKDLAVYTSNGNYTLKNVSSAATFPEALE